MRQAVIHDRPDFTVTSHGNGTAYTFTHKPSGRSVFFQGDDAITFRGEIEAYENANPDMEYDAIFSQLWSDYETVAQ